ncbi:MAG: bifunctional metallophosphatase/5'-nucleotidase [Nocardioides sp.]
MSIRLRSGLALAATLALAAAVPLAPSSAQSAKPEQPRLVPIQMLAINDFHGNLAPPSGSSGTVTRLNADGTTTPLTVGGAAYLATHLQMARAGHPNTLTVSAGDNIGASPLLSAAFHDEPTILALNAMGLQVSSVGNHEFDEGSAELLRMQNGGCRTDDGCYDMGHPFPGAAFQYLAANVISDATHQPLLPPFWVRNVNGNRIGFIGVTLKGTPDIVTASGVAGLKFQDEVTTINHYAQVLQKQGVKAIVAIVHQGGIPASPAYNYDCNAGGPGSGVTGDIVPIAEQISPKVDLILTGHTHTAYVCDIPDPDGQPRLVTSASSFGRLFTDVEGQINTRSHDFVRSSLTATNVPVTRDVTPDPAVSAIIDRYNTLIGPIQNRPVGYISADILGRGATTPEEPLGDVIADSQLAATSSADTGNAVVAFMNPGGIRADLVYKASGSEGDGVVTYGEAFTVQPFTNLVETVSLTGAQIVTLLQEQFSGPLNTTAPKVLQVSQGFTYTLDRSKTGADKVDVSSIRLNGAPLDPSASYRVTVNNFLAGGGDGFSVLTQGTDPVISAVDIDAFVDYLTANSSAGSPLAPPPANRITVLD